MNNKGISFIELIVYIALFAIVSLLVGKQFKELVNRYVGNKRIVRQQSDARDLMSIMAREIRNTGLKIYLHSITTDSLVRLVAPGVAVSATDNSSFNHIQGDPGDSLTIYKAQLTPSGDWNSIVDTVRYYLDGTTLKREYKTTGTQVATTSIAENVFALQYQYGVLGSNTALFDQNPLSTSANWSLIKVTGTTPVKTDATGSSTLTFNAVVASTGYLKYSSTVSIQKNKLYSVLLNITASNGFPDNLDSLRFSFGDVNHSTLYGSEKFKPFTDSIRITVPVKASTNSAYLFLEYYVKSTGTLTVNGIEASCSELGAYSWTWNPTAAEKAYVRAIRVYALTRTSGKAGTVVNTPITVGEVSVPRSGEYTWRLYTETIETPNNGSL